MCMQETLKKIAKFPHGIKRADVYSARFNQAHIIALMNEGYLIQACGKIYATVDGIDWANQVQAALPIDAPIVLVLECTPQPEPPKPTITLQQLDLFGALELPIVSKSRQDKSLSDLPLFA